MTGNRVQVLAVSSMELARLVEQHDPLLASIRTDGRTVIGTEIGAFLAASTRTDGRGEQTTGRRREHA